MELKTEVQMHSSKGTQYEYNFVQAHYQYIIGCIISKTFYYLVHVTQQTEYMLKQVTYISPQYIESRMQFRVGHSNYNYSVRSFIPDLQGLNSNKKFVLPSLSKR